MFLIKLFCKRAPTISLVFDKAYCQIYYYSNIKAIHLDWKNHATHDQFIEACNFSLNLMVEKKAKKMIADNSKVVEVSVENQLWLTENWFPRALEKGFQYSAVISSDKNSVKSALQLIVSRINTNSVIVKYFNELSQAKEWLSKTD